MKKEIVINGEKIEYTSRRYRKSKNLRLAIDSYGGLTASRPWYVGERTVANFILERAEWIMEKINQARVNNSGKVFRDSKKEYSTYKEQARKIVLSRIAELNKNYQFEFSKIFVRNQKTRWGSCSSRGNLNFNYKIVFLSEKMVDYIIVHELCHLKEMNHSERFWRLVAQEVLDYKIIRKDLQKKGIELR